MWNTPRSLAVLEALVCNMSCRIITTTLQFLLHSYEAIDNPTFLYISQCQICKNLQLKLFQYILIDVYDAMSGEPNGFLTYPKF